MNANARGQGWIHEKMVSFIFLVVAKFVEKKLKEKKKRIGEAIIP